MKRQEYTKKYMNYIKLQESYNSIIKKVMSINITNTQKQKNFNECNQTRH